MANALAQTGLADQGESRGEGRHPTCSTASDLRREANVRLLPLPLYFLGLPYGIDILCDHGLAVASWRIRDCLTATTPRPYPAIKPLPETKNQLTLIFS
jgi:hypothetical protein